MTVFLGQAIDLSLFLLKNGMVFTGQSPTVKVTNISTGPVVLPVTLLVESVTTPGLYSFLFVNPPSVESDLLAEYTAVETTKTEEIRIVKRTVESIEAQVVSAEVSDNRVIVEVSQNTIEGQIDPSNIISGEVTDGQISGKIDQNTVGASVDC